MKCKLKWQAEKTHLPLHQWISRDAKITEYQSTPAWCVEVGWVGVNGDRAGRKFRMFYLVRDAFAWAESESK